MKNLFRRWFGSAPDAGGEVASPAKAWAEAAGHRFAPARGSEGFVIESVGAGGAWRAEWGPSQRDYIEGMELRVRADIGDAGDLQMLAITRTLVARLENEVFEQFTEGNQTRIDDRTPEEMRWLVLYPPMPRSTLGALRERFAVLANRSAAAPMWIEGPLASALEGTAGWLDAATTPFVMVVQRGRFVLRMALPQPTPEALQAAVALAGVAAAAARRVGAEVMRGSFGSERPSSWGPVSAADDAEAGRP
jgi:hypothetical protein